MSPYLSRKITILSFVSIMVVLYIHVSFDPSELPDINLYIQKGIAGVWGRLAVPMFFCISGFLYFQKIKSIGDVYVKVKKRFRSLVIPFIIAACVFVLFFYILSLIPGAGKFQKNSFFEGFVFTIPNLLQYTFISTHGLFHGEPWAYHLWFLRDLIVIIITTPLAYYIFKNGSLLIIATTALLFYFITNIEIFSSFFWFYLGFPILLYLNKKSDDNNFLILMVLWGLFLILSVMDVFLNKFPKPYYYYADILIALSGVVAVWLTYDKFSSFRNTSSKLPSFISNTFFIYLYHAPSITILHKAFVSLFGANIVGYGLGYILPPPLLFLALSILGNFLKKNWSGYNVLTGGR